jgi:hypothetical protein
MKLFQQLLVAPAALGLMAPMAVNAAELNINEVSDYSASSADVQSISNFSDVYPTDWAFKALTDLAERHGCAAATPTGSITRYEAAALLNKCLGNVAQVTSEERRLLNEFGPELAVIKGRIDGLESRVGEFEAGAFSSTTKMSGDATFLVGSVSGAGLASGAESALESTYKWTMKLKTSYTGDDLLYAKIETGNADSSSFNDLGDYETGSSALDIEELHYTFPVGDFTVTAGPMSVDVTQSLGATTSVYDAPILDVMSFSGNPAIFDAVDGAGAGISYSNGNGWSYGFGAVADSAADATKGAFTKEGTDAVAAQIGYESDNWGAAFTYADGDTWDGISIAGYYQPSDTGVVPSISAGYGTKNLETKTSSDTTAGTQGTDDGSTWMVGLQWDEVGPGTLGAAYGTAVEHYDINSYPDKDQMAYEIWYSYPISDNVTITPGIYVVEQYSPTATDLDDKTGFVVKTTFKF